MSSSNPGQASGNNNRSNLPTFGNFGNTLLERGNPGLRRSTPDSEALASSDEEVEQSRLRTTGQRKNLTNRRSSLLADQTSDNRRGSLAGSSYSGATGSQPNTPGVSQDSWSTISPSATLGSLSGYPFGSSIWGNREPPSRLQEVTVGDDGRLPFPIPTQPNPSTYRSMSFSVGQTETNLSSQSYADGRARPNPSIQRRPSRQSNLGGDGSTLLAVNEIDDDGTGFSRDFETSLGGTGPRTIHGRNPTRAVSSSAVQLSGLNLRNGRSRTSLLDTAELAIDDTEESIQLRNPQRNAPVRRLSDLQSAQQARQTTASLLSGATFSGRRAGPQWTTDLDFGALEAIPQSRRHSFADVPTRRGSLGSHGRSTLRNVYSRDLLTSREEGNEIGFDLETQGLPTGNEREYMTLKQIPACTTFLAALDSEDAYLRARNYAETYFDTWDVKRDDHEIEVQKKLQRQRMQEGRSPYNVPANFGAYHGTSNTPLHIVNFKCCRSDVFYVQEDTGLQVQPGDLVIVEADRGTDLGTVQHVNVTWEEARAYKAHYAEEHYKWLMMFSQQTRSGGPNAENPNPVNPGRGQQGSGHREPHGDIKPKMIKRLAQRHEFQKLQDKEGNEAKAKRMCQQRVAEHGLNMEILDAEYQMDGKKLTFYYFADTYINFNALVTDLFKLYKTRIWMSAINPASFMTPTSQLGLTPAYPSSNFGVPPSQFQPSNGMGYEDPRHDHRSMPNPQRQPIAGAYFGGYANSGIGNGMTAYPSNMQPPMDPFSGYAPQPYGMFQPRQQAFGVNRPDSIPRPGQPGSPSDLANQFGSMSLARHDPFAQNRYPGGAQRNP